MGQLVVCDEVVGEEAEAGVDTEVVGVEADSRDVKTVVEVAVEAGVGAVVVPEVVVQRPG